jgi:hypothetical protein
MLTPTDLAKDLIRQYGPDAQRHAERNTDAAWTQAVEAHRTTDEDPEALKDYEDYEFAAAVEVILLTKKSLEDWR